jgi:hypothetical protein
MDRLEAWDTRRPGSLVQSHSHLCRAPSGVHGTDSCRETRNHQRPNPTPRGVELANRNEHGSKREICVQSVRDRLRDAHCWRHHQEGPLRILRFDDLGGAYGHLAMMTVDDHRLHTTLNLSPELSANRQIQAAIHYAEAVGRADHRVGGRPEEVAAVDNNRVMLREDLRPCVGERLPFVDQSYRFWKRHLRPAGQRYSRSAANGRGNEATDPFVRLQRRVRLGGRPTMSGDKLSRFREFLALHDVHADGNLVPMECAVGISGPQPSTQQQPGKKDAAIELSAPSAEFIELGCPLHVRRRGTPFLVHRPEPDRGARRPCRSGSGEPSERLSVILGYIFGPE